MDILVTNIGGGMGYIRHDAVIVTTWDDRAVKRIKDYRQEAGYPTQPLLVGPFEGTINGQKTFVWIPDGSKEGWTDSDVADDARNSFLLFCKEAKDLYVDIVKLNFGGDDKATRFEAKQIFRAED